MIKMVFMDEDPDDAIEVPSLAASQEKVGEGLRKTKIWLQTQNMT